MTDPGFSFVDGNSAAWRPSSIGAGIQVMPLGEANGQTMELVRFAPDTGFPNHEHVGPEFVYMLEGSGRQAGQWMQPGWGSAAITGSHDIDFISGPEGCTLLTVYSESVLDSE